MINLKRQVRLKIGFYEKADKAFLRHHRENLHEYFLKAVKLHCSSTANLKSLFSVICLIVLEVPCGSTAAAAACMVMAIQDYAIKEENLSATCRYHLLALTARFINITNLWTLFT